MENSNWTDIRPWHRAKEDTEFDIRSYTARRDTRYFVEYLAEYRIYDLRYSVVRIFGYGIWKRSYIRSNSTHHLHDPYCIFKTLLFEGIMIAIICRFEALRKMTAALAWLLYLLFYYDYAVNEFSFLRFFSCRGFLFPVDQYI